MLISHSKKFIFIHVYKVAGTSVRVALSPYCYPNKITRLKNKLFNIQLIQSSDFKHHVTSLDIKKGIPEDMFNTYFKFAFVRNPWDWQVSLYHFTQQNKEHFQHDLVSKMTFDDYIKWRVEEAICSQLDFLYDDNRNLLVDYVGKIENIGTDFQNVCDKIGVKNTLGHANKSIHKDYKSMYSDRNAQLIADAYSEEIKLLGYNFE